MPLTGRITTLTDEENYIPSSLLTLYKINDSMWNVHCTEFIFLTPYFTPLDV